MLMVGINVPLKMPFVVTDVDGITLVTGLTDGSFTKALFLDDAPSAVPITVTEIGGGYYYVQFTPDEVGRWYFTITTPAHDILEMLVAAGEYDPQDSMALLQKAAFNRLEVDLTAQELVLYEDDGVAVKQRWPLESDEGPPTDLVITQPGVQTKRKAPLL
jgi:hypothetical protein